MANISAIKLPNGTTYTLKDNGALQLTGGQVTGPVTFDDGVSVTQAPSSSYDAANKSYVDSGDFKSTIASLTVAGWSSNSQTVTVSGVTASNTVIVSPAPASYSEYSVCGVYCSAQSANSLTFTCSETPSGALTVNILYR